MNLSFDHRKSNPEEGSNARCMYPTAAPAPAGSTTAASFRPMNSHHSTLVTPEPSERYKFARDPPAQIRQAIQESCMQCGGSAPTLWRTRFSRGQEDVLSYVEFTEKVKGLGSGIQLTPGDVALVMTPLDEAGVGGVTASLFTLLLVNVY